jgi:hypothetical protein
MRYQQNAVLTSLRRAQQFFDTHGDGLNGVNPSIRKQLDDVVTQLSDLSITQDSGSHGSKGETARQRALRATLRHTHMVPITEIAKFRLRDVPEFAALRLPASRIAVLSTVAAAYSMADAASAHAQTFVDNGLATTFADDLRTAAAAVGASLVDRDKQEGRRTGATAGLGAEEKRGRGILRVLNALVMAHIGDDARLIAEWTAAKIVRKKPGPAAGSLANGPAPIHSAPVMATPTPVTPPVAVAA